MQYPDGTYSGNNTGGKSHACITALFHKATTKPNQKLLLMQCGNQSDRTYTFANGSMIHVPADPHAQVPQTTDPTLISEYPPRKN